MCSTLPARTPGKALCAARHYLEGLGGLGPHFRLPLGGGAGGHRGSDDEDGGEARRLLDELHHQGDGGPHVLHVNKD